ncbi:hypothetical protein B0J13DRAFT_84957 [Dactylonectria estremocensis]|uniref:DUF7735 domain-containing protein n=1 Tax=Dactylonectria estremocensis TaxID=1079267 RepID=A0A9P9EBW6_9HYPO|nr:hypothetical protein B0J13DRAFT_84957 [Dactylonectria estremocensis]
MQSKILVSSLMVSAVTATSGFMAAYPHVKREIEARATSAYTYMTAVPTTGIYSPECQTAVLDLYDDVPMPPSDIVSDLLENPQTDPCDFTTPASLSDEYASYTSEVSSWFEEHKDEFSSAIKDCPALTEYTSGFACPTGSSSSNSDDNSDSSDSSDSGSSGSSGSGSSDATATDGSNDASETTSSNDSKTTGAASRLTGMGYAAVAVAGAVVAML